MDLRVQICVDQVGDGLPLLLSFGDFGKRLVLGSLQPLLELNLLVLVLSNPI